MTSGNRDELREPSGWTMWVNSASEVQRLSLLTVLVIPIGLAVIAALGVQPQMAFGLVILSVLIPPVVGLTVGRMGDSGLRLLDARRRRRAVYTVLTGVPDGDPTVDEVSARVMLNLAGRPRWDRAVGVFLCTLVAGVFLTAGLRGSRWWLLVGAIDVVCMVGLTLATPTRNATQALARFGSDRDEPIYLTEE